MTHWDGLASTASTGEPQRICILGATNRIQDIDEAILRRMPKKFPVSLPSAHQRRGIFTLILRDTKLDKRHFDIEYLVKVSAGMSGSDIKEACRDAAMLPVRECIQLMKKQGRLREAVDARDVRGIRTTDFFGKGSGLAYAGLDQGTEVREKERRRRGRAEEIVVGTDDEGFETTDESEGDKERVRVVEKENGPD